MVAQVLQLFKSTCDGGESANCTSDRGSVAVVGQVLDRLGEHGDIGVAQNLQRLAVVSVRSGASSGLVVKIKRKSPEHPQQFQGVLRLAEGSKRLILSTRAFGRTPVFRRAMRGKGPDMLDAQLS
jgi:hypothetical protein